MKILANIISGIMFLLYGIIIIGYFTSMWGAIGFFGAILTFPISFIVGAFLIMLSNTQVFITSIIWFTIAILLLYFGSSEN